MAKHQPREHIEAQARRLNRTCALVVGAASALRLGDILLESGAELAKIVPQACVVAQPFGTKLGRETAGEFSGVLQVIRKWM